MDHVSSEFEPWNCQAWLGILTLTLGRAPITQSLRDLMQMVKAEPGPPSKLTHTHLAPAQ
jgi:hypothetical protein